MTFALFQNRIRLFLFLILIFLISCLRNSAQTTSQLLLTEISPHPQDSNCEYFVIYNISNSEIDLTNKLTITDNLSTDTIKTSIKFTSKSGMIMSPQDYALVIDDDCINIDNITSNFDKSKLLVLTAGTTIGNGLSNTSDEINLKLDNVSQDSFKWIQDYGVGKIFKRLNLTSDSSNNNWSIDGISLSNYFSSSSTSNKTNSSQSNISNSISQTQATQTQTSYQNLQVINSKDIIISEIYPSPDSKLNEKEWIELYNNTNSQIDLSQFYLQDLSGSKYKLSNSIESNQYLQIFPTISLNNSGDTISLFYNSSLIDKVSYSQTESGQSWIKNANSTLILTCKQTPQSQNISISCITSTQGITKTTNQVISKRTYISSTNSAINSKSISYSSISLDLNSLDMRNEENSSETTLATLSSTSREVLGIATELPDDNSQNFQLLGIPILSTAVISIILLIRKSKSDKILK